MKFIELRGHVDIDITLTSLRKAIARVCAVAAAGHPRGGVYAAAWCTT